ncbi:XdhC family protein [Brevibacterium linens]|uniref:Xanthine dehydrogenase accessory factor n=1 Tax=Brevibacterium linens ATCC 9172 TaxID=1255617 RepID=A0A2H1KAY9_BRELN|nr:XdhC/CoxI family protein [Brevibacterium linens]KAB1946117.1 XdhC family protein [Brevibacterium linens ATCC 9172]SMX96819.1 xanthine dehydrogenase accessory factor [Brevibacterium linens ATCC 9172]
MLDILSAAATRLFDSEEPQDVAVATIIETEGSVPRPAGTSMLVDAAGGIVGSLTGGCVEGAVLEACQDALATGDASVQGFGYSDEDAFVVGLMCGGRIDVLIQPFRAGCSGLRAESEPVAVVLRLPSDDAWAPAAAVSAAAVDGSTGQSTDALAVGFDPLVPDAVVETALQRVGAFIRSGRTGRVRLAPPEGGREPIELFVETRITPAHLLVVGANAFGHALVEAARPLGLRITVCDPRPAFADPASYPGAEVVRAWPHRFLVEAAATGELDDRSMICVLSHDPKVDIPTLAVALDLDVAYVGAMGSRRSDRDRRAALREAGVASPALARLHSPIGLHLETFTPAEVAVSILAEILAVRGGRRQVVPLSDEREDSPLR